MWVNSFNGDLGTPRVSISGANNLKPKNCVMLSTQLMAKTMEKKRILRIKEDVQHLHRLHHTSGILMQRQAAEGGN